MPLNFNNFHTFEIAASIYFLTITLRDISDPVILFLSLVFSIAILFHGINGWRKRQSDEDKKVKMEADMADARLEFDIKGVTAINERVPLHITEDGKEHDFISMASVDILINVVNPSLISNHVRDVKVRLSSKGEKEDLNFIVTDFDTGEIQPRKQETMVVKALVMNYIGKNHDKLKVTLFSIDKKDVKSETVIKRWETKSEKVE